MFNYNILLSPNHKDLVISHLSDNEEIVYYLLDTDNLLLKIGKSKNVSYRIKQLETANPFNLQLLHISKSTFFDLSTSELEKHLHYIFADYHKKGEWFYFKDDLELFMIDMMKRRYSELSEKDNNFNPYYTNLDVYFKYLIVMKKSTTSRLNAYKGYLSSYSNDYYRQEYLMCIG